MTHPSPATDCEECAEFWSDIVAPDGNIDLAAIAAELHDYRVVLSEVARAYCDVTDGRFSKPNTRAEHIIAAVDERIEALDAALTAANQDAALGWEWAEQFVDPGLVTDEGWNEWLEDLAAHRHAVARRARLSDGADDD